MCCCHLINNQQHWELTQWQNHKLYLSWWICIYSSVGFCWYIFMLFRDFFITLWWHVWSRWHSQWWFSAEEKSYDPWTSLLPFWFVKCCQCHPICVTIHLNRKWIQKRERCPGYAEWGKLENRKVQRKWGQLWRVEREQLPLRPDYLTSCLKKWRVDGQEAGWCAAL